MKNNSIEYMHYNNIVINWDNLTLENKEKLIDDVVLKHSFARVKSLGKKDLLDSTTANMLKTIKDNLNLENKNKFLSCNLYKAVTIGWKLIK